MKALFASSATLTLLAITVVNAGDIESGIEAGGRIGPYATTKCAGIEDGVKVGQTLCYT